MRVVDLKIHDIAFGGKGVGRENGKAVFIPLTIEGELVSAKITREKKQFAEAELVDLRERSPHRVEPPCPYFGWCGGCAYQHIAYPHQLEIKSRQVEDVLRRIGKIKEVPMRAIVSSPREYGYRNRVTVHAENGVVGYFRRESHRLIDVEQCPIAMDKVNRELAELRSHDVPDGHYTLRAKVDRPLRGRSTRSENGAGGSRATSTGKPERVSSQGSERINAFHHFSQTNDEVADALRELIVNATPANQELLVDAFCGAGFFAKALLDKFERVIGIDWDRFAIATAKETATPKETYIAGDVEEELAKASRNGGFQAADLANRRSGDRRSLTLIVDPPATGLTASIRKAIVDLAPATVLYVSCNPATLARDLSELQSRFKIEAVTPLDMFPQTAEIEVLTQLSVEP